MVVSISPSPIFPISHSSLEEWAANPRLTKRAPTACRHVVSGSLSSPCRGSSHLSLALLGSLSVAREYLALRDGPRGFRPAFTCLVLLRCRTGAPIFAAYGTITRYGGTFQNASAKKGLGNSPPLKAARSYNPARTSPDGLGYSAFARRY